MVDIDWSKRLDDLRRTILAVHAACEYGYSPQAAEKAAAAAIADFTPEQTKAVAVHLASLIATDLLPRHFDSSAEWMLTYIGGIALKAQQEGDR